MAPAPKQPGTIPPKPHDCRLSVRLFLMSALPAPCDFFPHPPLSGALAIQPNCPSEGPCHGRGSKEGLRMNGGTVSPLSVPLVPISTSLLKWNLNFKRFKEQFSNPQFPSSLETSENITFDLLQVLSGWLSTSVSCVMLVSHELPSTSPWLTHKRAFKPTRLPLVSGKNSPILRKLIPMETLQRNNSLTA